MADVLVHAPAAVERFGLSRHDFQAPSPRELNHLLSARIRELEQMLCDLETTTGMIANAALSLAFVSLERDGRAITDGVVVSGGVTSQMEGARLILGESDGDLVVQIGER